MRSSIIASILLILASYPCPWACVVHESQDVVSHHHGSALLRPEATPGAVFAVRRCDARRGQDAEMT